MRYVLERLEDYIAGLVTGAIGTFIIIEGLSYRMGSLHSMGPGYFPVILGGIMVLLALFMVLSAQPEKMAQIGPEDGQLRGMAFLAAAFVGFALTVENLGMLASVAIAVFLASLANRKTSLITALILAVGTAVVSALVFRVGLGLQIKAF
ncbi:tripartite tricarboxylate transporter TctB family protein [Pseudooceanicola sediminis]|uniref:Tripartite tricarboxylate transporter TctB family protein n=1 Tax=Pseudooceanicola sediminis TaxID=2211117 RepID=A0A399J0G6_9RHOB|nr:tripartite tricarboxylate transporter TctB family protein [Pseudooceanicola sediminis]KAA2315098.1 tripartite tricarboxylate transporter TctB family protein [Puniceibacterium sp. HSS470]RII38913.1 tripartite tricarboxylate transporter TctB family protein [Pseudooceanicola sediminis]|tara:strand:+ start:46731 stop:47180 length:450 start_codon:yes stop_codon:yes gene_type:complete